MSALVGKTVGSARKSRLRAALELSPQAGVERLQRMARKFSANDDLVEDIAQSVFLRAWEYDPEVIDSTVWSYMAAMVQHEFVTRYKGGGYGRGRSEPSLCKRRESQDDCFDLKRLTTPANQLERMEVIDALKAVDNLADHERDAVLSFVYFERVDEAAMHLGIRENALTKRLIKARLELCARLGKKVKTSKSGFRGVRPNHRRWESYIQDGGHRCLGFFDTPEEAAKVRDVAAYTLWGAKAKFNFPEMMAETIRGLDALALSVAS